MSNECTLKVDRPIQSVCLVDPAAAEAVQKELDASAQLRRQQEAEVQSLRLARKSLEAAAAAVQAIHEKMVAEQAQQIAHLAVEIARKILKSSVERGNYDIQAVVEEALKQAPMKHNVRVHLHPEDLANCKAIQEADGGGPLGAAELVADAGVGRAECVIETPKGSVESLIEEHLARVEEVLRSGPQGN
jgi:flagellar biosynthesis/type III secretory pathway protein FliH